MPISAQPIGSQPIQPRFAGHRVLDNGVRLFLPGREKQGADHQMIVRYHHGSPKKFREEAMAWTGKQWEFPSGKVLPHNEDLHYVFVEKQAGKPDQLITDSAYQKNGYNVIPAGSKDPTGLGPVALVFRDSIVPEDTLKTIAQTSGTDTTRFVRTHANRLGGSEKADILLQQLARKFGLQGIQERPLIGGDNLSSHGYWTNSLFQVNNKVSGPAGLEKLALANLESGMRLFFDGAFVNEGLQGVHYLSNLYYGKNSPFLEWFDYGSLNQFPHQPLKLGILPVKIDVKTGEDVANTDAWDIRFIQGTDINGPSYIELYDPRLEDAVGTPYPPAQVQANLLRTTGCPFLTNSQDTVQNYRFPVSQEEFEQKRDDIKLARGIKDPFLRQQKLEQLKREWQNFELTISVEDASGYNWDGQRDVKKINIARPEVTDYVKNACVYWTDKIDCLYTSHVAKSLANSLPNGPVSAATALNAINANTQATTGQPGVLPALNVGEANPITLASLQKALAGYAQQKKAHTLNAGQTMRAELVKNFYPESLPGSPMLQMILNHPNFKPMLNEGNKPVWLAATVAVLGPIFNFIDTISGRLRPFQRLIHWLTPRSFMEHLEEKLNDSLTPALKQKLKDPVLGHLVQEKLGRSLFLTLLTGQFVDPLKADPTDQEVGERFSKRFTSYDAPPDVLADRLNDFLTHQLRLFDTDKLNKSLEGLLAGVTPEAAVIARHALHQRKLGLHWRIDALKDMGDMDGVRALPEKLRDAKLAEEMAKVGRIMGTVSAATRQVFPESIIKAEVTLGGLASNEGPLLEKLLQGPSIDSIPNYTWQYSAGHKAVRMTTEPDGYPPEQIGPADYIKNNLKGMMAAMPLDKAMLLENMTSNHDKSTSLFGLALHQFQARFDYLDWFGINFNDNGDQRGSFQLALNELEYKPQMGFLLKNGLDTKALKQVRDFSSSAAFQQILKSEAPVLYQYTLHKEARQDLPGRPENETKRAVPFEAKAAYVDQLFDAMALPQSGITLNATEQAAMKAAVKEVFLEPSESKAMRGKLMNGLQALESQPQWFGSKPAEQALGKQALAEASPRFAPTFWGILQQIPERHRRWIGYRQIDQVIDFTFNAMMKDLPATATLKTNPQAAPLLKQALYNVVMAPALEHYKRIAAMQIAIPGDPTFYLPDLLGQAGGEDLKNMYLGNREAIRFDWLNTNPLIKGFCDDLGKIILQRHQNQVLNNGQLELPLDPTRSKAEADQLSKTSIMPLIRDNGTEQAICLVNFGAPEGAWNSWMGAQTTSRYPELNSTKRVIKNYKLDLSHINLPEGTYKSVDPEHPGELFIVKKDGDKRQLVRQDNPTQGIDVHIARTLVRVN